MFLVAIMPGKMLILLFILKTVKGKRNFAASSNMDNILFCGAAAQHGPWPPRS
jgi:hypothetical protein